jgi:hypothetical protein
MNHSGRCPGRDRRIGRRHAVRGTSAQETDGQLLGTRGQTCFCSRLPPRPCAAPPAHQTGGRRAPPAPSAPPAPQQTAAARCAAFCDRRGGAEGGSKGGGEGGLYQGLQQGPVLLCGAGAWVTPRPPSGPARNPPPGAPPACCGSLVSRLEVGVGELHAGQVQRARVAGQGVGQRDGGVAPVQAGSRSPGTGGRWGGSGMRFDRAAMRAASSHAQARVCCAGDWLCRVALKPALTPRAVSLPCLLRASPSPLPSLPSSDRLACP